MSLHGSCSYGATPMFFGEKLPEMMNEHPKLYTALAAWFTTLTSPEEYEEEANLYHQIMQSESDSEIVTVLELGAGTGNNASHMKHHYQMTLTDFSAEMVAESRKLNPECEHHVGDMRSIRLDRQFDAVFIHDAIVYMTTLDDLTSALKTAAIHCKANGLVMVVPDFTRETFVPSTVHGGGDHPKSMRYLQWTWQPEDETSAYFMDFAYLLRDGLDMRTVYDRHVCGLFGQDEWLAVFESVGLSAKVTQSSILGEADTYQPIFIAKKV